MSHVLSEIFSFLLLNRERTIHISQMKFVSTKISDKESPKLLKRRDGPLCEFEKSNPRCLLEDCRKSNI